MMIPGSWPITLNPQPDGGRSELFWLPSLHCQPSTLNPPNWNLPSKTQSTFGLILEEHAHGRTDAAAKGLIDRLRNRREVLGAVGVGAVQRGRWQLWAVLFWGRVGEAKNWVMWVCLMWVPVES